jgi:hypothetical protein
MFQKSKVKLFTICLLTLFLLPSLLKAAEVPFEVVKTEVVAETTVPAGPEGVVVDGILKDEGEEQIGDGGYDPRVKVPVDNIIYKMEFWNVGKMGGEKGFVFKSSYEKAKLTIKYDTGQAYRMAGTGEKFLDMEAVEQQNVDTPDFKDTFSYDLWFTGGPYGRFFHTDKDGKNIMVAEIENGKYIRFNQLPEKIYLVYPERALIEITNSSAFEKWLELMNTDIDCSKIDNPRGDSGVRFSDFSGEVMVRPCDDEDAEYGAELDMVLHNNDVIRTGDDSTCVLSLADMTTFIMKPESIIIIGGGTEESKLHLIWGKIKTNFKRMMEGGSLEVEMSEAVAGIRGTILITEENENGSTLKVLEGKVEFTSKATGKSEMVGPGEMITATKDGLKEKIQFDTSEEETTWKKPAEADSVPQVSMSEEKNETINNENKTNTEKSHGLTYLLMIFLILGAGLIYFKKINPKKN